MAASVARQIAGAKLTGCHVPFWFWNGPLDPQIFSDQVSLMADQGITGVMPHPRFGMDRRQYLEDSYWRAMDATIKRAIDCGSQVLLYDEYNWPSGAAGGRALDGHPEFLPRALDFAVRDIAEAGYVTLDGFTAGETYSGVFEKVIAAFLVDAYFSTDVTDADNAAAPAEGGCDAAPRAWGSVSPDGNSISGELAAGGWRILVFFQTMCSYPSRINPGSDAFLGYLQPGATDHFIALTHDAYAERYQQHFGTLIPAIFTDEPSTISPGPFPWCDDFVEEFHRRRSFSLLDALPSLCSDSTADAADVRMAYWQTVTELFDERFFARVANWCREHNIALTGHIFDENIAAWPCAPHLMKFLRRFDWPGIDALGTHARAVGCKIPASVAHLESKEHFLCEAMGLADGWNANFAMLKRGYHYLGVMGVDVFVPHGFHQTIENPRVECPPSFFYQNPYWPYYRRIVELTDRLSAFNQSGSHLAPVAVYYPIESLWADGTGGRGQGGYPWQQKNRGNRHAIETIEAFNGVIEALSAGAFDCDVVDTHSLCEAVLDNPAGVLSIADESFGCLVMPSVRVLPLEILPVIENFVKAGGLLVLVGNVSDAICPDDASGSVAAFFERIKTNCGSGHVVQISSGQRDEILPLLGKHLSATVGFPQGKPPGLCVMARHGERSTQWLFVNDEHAPIKTQVLLPKDRLPQISPGAELAVSCVCVDSGEILSVETMGCEQGILFELQLDDTEAVVIIAELLEASSCQPDNRLAKRCAEQAATSKVHTLDNWTLQLLPMDSRDINASSAWIDLPVFRFHDRSKATPCNWHEKSCDDSHWPTVAAVRGEALNSAQVALFRATLPPGASGIGQPIAASGEYAMYLNGECLDDRIGPPADEGVLELAGAAGMDDLLALEICSEVIFLA